MLVAVMARKSVVTRVTIAKSCNWRQTNDLLWTTHKLLNICVFLLNTIHQVTKLLSMTFTPQIE